MCPRVLPAGVPAAVGGQYTWMDNTHGGQKLVDKEVVLGLPFRTIYVDGQYAWRNLISVAHLSSVPDRP